MVSFTAAKTNLMFSVSARKQARNTEDKNRFKKYLST